MQLPDAIKTKLRELPDKPGCYLMRDRTGRIIYVGKAISLRRRVQYYFRKATARSAPPKLRGLIRSIADFDLIVVRTEADAVLTEGQLIKNYRPRYNLAFKDDKRFPLLRVDLQQPFPQFRLCRLQRDDGARYFGPYASGRAAHVALEFIEKRFGVRKCAAREPGVAEHRHCINDIVRFCAAPCVGKTTPEEYRRRVEEACAFLEGERPDVLRELAETMEAAAHELRFEKAAALRDTLEALRLAVRRRAHVARTAGVGEDVARAGVAALGTALGLPAPPRRIEAFDVSNISGTHAVAAMVAAEDGVPRPARYRRFRIRLTQAADDARMVAEAVERRYARLLKEGVPLPDLVLIDGGAIQLRAARAALARLGLDTLPAAGLAKRFEELYHEKGGAAHTLRLPDDSPALHVLQRLRDEAHRFALGYHLRLRGRRIRESRLDEIPGVGAQRKRALLRHFGSVARLARASEEELMAVPGVGADLARTLRSVLGADLTARSEKKPDAPYRSG